MLLIKKVKFIFKLSSIVVSWKFIEHIADTSLDDLPKDYEKKNICFGENSQI